MENISSVMTTKKSIATCCMLILQLFSWRVYISNEYAATFSLWVLVPIFCYFQIKNENVDDLFVQPMEDLYFDL